MGVLLEAPGLKQLRCENPSSKLSTISKDPAPNASNTAVLRSPHMPESLDCCNSVVSSLFNVEISLKSRCSDVVKCFSELEEMFVGIDRVETQLDGVGLRKSCEIEVVK